MFAAFSREDRGTATAQFLKLGAGARALAMGEAYSAVTDDATALYWNPAGLTRLAGSEASLMHAPYLDSTFYDYAVFGQRRNAFAWAGSLQYFSAGSLDQRDENNSDLGHFTPYDLAAALGCAWPLGESGASFGISGKYIRSKIVDAASTWALDAGVQSRLYFDRLRLGFSASNLGGTMKFEQANENLPLVLRLGTAFKLTDRWLASLDVIAPRDNAPYPALGVEYRRPVSSALTVAARAGYNSRTANDVDGFTGASFGFGADFGHGSIDYALVPFGTLGLTHRISVSLRWGQGAQGLAVHDSRQSLRPPFDGLDGESDLFSERESGSTRAAPR